MLGGINFKSLWRELRPLRWTAKRPSVLATQWTYVPPGGNPKGANGVDCFLGEDAVVAHCLKNLPSITPQSTSTPPPSERQPSPLPTHQPSPLPAPPVHQPPAPPTQKPLPSFTPDAPLPGLSVSVVSINAELLSLSNVPVPSPSEPIHPSDQPSDQALGTSPILATDGHGFSSALVAIRSVGATKDSDKEGEESQKNKMMKKSLTPRTGSHPTDTTTK